MSNDGPNRKLAAILAVDVVGYSRLMEANEEATLAALRHLRRDFFDPTIAKYRGRIFKTMGDGFLIEFNSVIDATRCAVEVQTGMPLRNAGIVEDRQLQFRMGVHVGDVILQDEDVFGEGVNLATRLEALAWPGGVACSATARQHVGQKLDLEFLDQGMKNVKNIQEPVQVYFINIPTVTAAPSGASRGLEASAAVRPVRPSVAILPFSNMSSDAEQEYFSDGISEDLITDLSKVSGLQVLSRNTVFTLKGKAQNLQLAARQLGVQYIVEGSVRKAGNRVRITAQLIEGATDHHLWAERYDRDLTDIFEVQDEITRSIVEQLKVRLLPDETAALEVGKPRDVGAYTSYLKAKQIFRVGTRSSLLQARQLYSRALELDPEYAQAYVGMANCSSYLRSFHGAEFEIHEVLATVGKALSLSPDLAEAHAARGIAYSVVDKREETVAAFSKALSLDPNNWEALYHFGRFYTGTGDFEAAASLYTRAMEVQPDDCEAVTFLSQVMEAMGRSVEARKYAEIGLKRAERALITNPENSRSAQLIANIYAYLGEAGYAKDWITKAFEIDPDDNHVRYNAACVYAVLGEFDKAFDLLEQWAPHVAPDSKLWFMNDPDFASMKQHPRYQELLKLVGGIVDE